jgi:hypothetical protein
MKEFREIEERMDEAAAMIFLPSLPLHPQHP